MARYRRYRSRRSTHNIGYERARQHIEDARRLTAELGGMDQDVKKYFFSLSLNDLNTILVTYGQRFGSKAEEYARETIPKWKSGTVHMSGTVAERLFSLLPPRMPLATKYRLAEGLWHHVGPSSKRTMLVGLDASIDAIVDLTRQHIESVVSEYRIPDQLERRFDWLSAGDVSIKQDLLNHLRNMERELVVEAARIQMPILLQHLRVDTAQHTSRLAQILKVGKHELELLLDRSASGVSIETASETARRNYVTKTSSGGNWWWLLIVAGVVAWFLIRSMR
jgi:hypothetical protein